jgi:hypothetical protein
MNPIWFPLVSADEEADFALDFFPGVVDHPHQRTSVKLAILPPKYRRSFLPARQDLQTPHPKTNDCRRFCIGGRPRTSINFYSVQ